MKKWNPFDIYNFTFDDAGHLTFCKVPASLGRCPACNSKLIVNVEGWYEENGILIPDDIDVDCLNALECWTENEHSQANRMPYVYWLPITEKVKPWVIRMVKIYHGLKPIPQRWLERNGQLKLPFA